MDSWTGRAIVYTMQKRDGGEWGVCVCVREEEGDYRELSYVATLRGGSAGDLCETRYRAEVESR